MGVGAIFSAEGGSTPYFVFQKDRLLGMGDPIEPSAFVLFTSSELGGGIDTINGSVVVNALAYGAYTLELDTVNPPRKDKIIVPREGSVSLPGHPNIQVKLGASSVLYERT